MDQQKLRTLVFEKTGVRIDIDDPVFALVALNEAVLAEAVERHVALLDQATDALAEQTDALRAEGWQARDGTPPPPRPKAKAGAAGLSQAELRIAAIAGGAAVLGALLVLGGQALWLRPPPAQPVAPALTADQAAALKEGEKLARAVQKLDAKSKSLIQAEMQKP